MRGLFFRDRDQDFSFTHGTHFILMRELKFSRSADPRSPLASALTRDDQALSSQPFLKVGFTHLLASSLLVIMPLVASYASLPS